MDNKIFALLKSDKENYLTLKMNKKVMFLDVWYVVTGSVEKGETYEEAALREIQEETQLKVLDIKDSGIVFDYHCKQWDKDAHEKVFFVMVKEDKPVLSEEHTDFLWLDKKSFFEKLYWYGQDKKSFQELLNRF